MILMRVGSGSMGRFTQGLFFPSEVRRLAAPVRAGQRGTLLEEPPRVLREHGEMCDRHWRRRRFL